MQAVREITKWDTNTNCNHTYLLDGDKMVAYIKFGDTVPFYFKSPIRIDKRGRKFLDLVANPFDIINTPVETFIIKVQGSKGETYTVNTEERTCTCPGFTFRGACKHTKDLE